MALPLRITFEGKDYSFQLLNKEKDELTILWADQTYVLVREKESWRLKTDGGSLSTGLANAIGKLISLRYRV
jgi:hypothetical protein